MFKKKALRRYIDCVAGLLLIISLVVSGLPVKVSAEKSTATGDGIIVSLGDSYSAGEGIEPFYGQNLSDEEKVKNEDWLAHRSEKSWPGMLTLPSVDGTMAENRDTHWYFTAVSGAVTDDIFGKQKKEAKKGKASNKKDMREQIKIFDDLGGKKADYVTLTLGGNDADFTGIITEVVTGSSYLKTSALSDKLNKVWKEYYADGGIEDKLKDTYKKIAEKAGEQAHIIVAGYPKLLEENGKGFFVSKEEAQLVNIAVSNFNNAIEHVVNECSKEGLRISFVSVEDAFEGHGAYSEDPYINEIMFGPKLQPQDLKDIGVSSSYSIHPNEKGAKAYAKCVQAEIDRLEALKDVSSEERDIVLVLDRSGSMAGTPMTETKKAATNFINTIMKEEASIGVVAYDNQAERLYGFSVNKAALTSSVSDIYDGGGTNIEAGLIEAHSMLSTSNAKKKIIVLMSDGEPNDGKQGDALVEYADQMKEEGIIIYTLGFFEALNYRTDAQILMERIASDGCHYEVANADDLVFFFEDVADQINGQRYIYVRIACPVDVRVSYQGQVLCSDEENLNVRTDFGTLTFEENENSKNNGADDRIKILRLKEGVDYDVEITGTGRGIMNYTIGFMDADGEYSDFRRFEDIKINKKTKIDTVATVSKTSELKIDEDGDGKYDLKLRAKENGYGEEVDNTWIIFAAVGGGVALVSVIGILVIVKKIKNKRTKERY